MARVAVVEQRLGDEPGGVGEVDEPRTGGAEAAHVVGDREDHGNGAQRLGEAARAGGLLPDAAEARRDGLVAQARRHAADAKLHEHERRPVDGRLSLGSRHETAGKLELAQDASREPADDREAAFIDVVQDELVDGQNVAAQADALDELGGVGAAAADDRDLDSHAGHLTVV